MSHAPVAVEPRPAPSGPAETRQGGTFGRLVRFALANIRRKPERAALAVVGIALAIAAVVVVRTIAAGYQVSGVGAVIDAVGDAPYWVVPEGGVTFDPTAGALLPKGSLPDVTTPDGWTRTDTLVGLLPGHDVALVGRNDAGRGDVDRNVRATPLALERLGVEPGGTVDIAGSPVVVRAVDGSGARIVAPLTVAQAAGLHSGWSTLTPPDGTTGTPTDVRAATGLVVTPDPAQRPAVGSGGLVYATHDDNSRIGFLGFDQKFAAVLGGQVSSSVLGLIAQVALGLGFVIAVTSFVAAVQERRREFGIMASIGLTDEVLYFFLVESLLVFCVAYVLGVGLGGVIVAGLLPTFFTLGNWLEAAGLVAMYLPALAIVAALVPVHRLLQQRPVRLLAEQP